MMWRDRIHARRGTGGRFTADDVSDALDPERCGVGELVQQGILTTAETHQFYLAFGGSGLAGAFLSAVWRDDLAGAEALLDQIEDQAIQIKRSRGETA